MTAGGSFPVLFIGVIDPELELGTGAEGIGDGVGSGWDGGGHGISVLNVSGGIR